MRGRTLEWFTGTIHRVEAEARAMPEEEVRDVDTDVPAFASVVLQHVPALLAEWRARFVFHNLPDVVVALDNLEGYSVVASDANATTPAPRRHTVDPADTALLETSTSLIATTNTEIGMLIARGWVQPSALEGLPTRRSFRNHSVCLMRHALILEQHTAQLLLIHSEITLEHIANYISVAERLGSVVAQRSNTHVKHEEDMAARTFTLLDKSVDEVRAALALFLRATPEKVEEYLPRKPKKPVQSKAKKTSPGDKKAPVDESPKSEKAPVEKSPNEKAAAERPPTKSANGDILAPSGSAAGNVAAPKHEEDRAAE